MSDCDNPRCIGGWEYNGVGGMIFPANTRCPKCNMREARPTRALKLDWDGTIIFVPDPETGDELEGTG